MEQLRKILNLEDGMVLRLVESSCQLHYLQLNLRASTEELLQSNSNQQKRCVKKKATFGHFNNACIQTYDKTKSGEDYSFD